MLDDAKLLTADSNARDRAMIELNRGVALVNLKRIKEAAAAYENALVLSREAGLAVTEASVLTNMGDIYLLSRNYPKAAEISRIAADKSRESGNEGTYATALANLGFAQIGQGQIQVGVATVNESLKISNDAGDIAAAEETYDELSQMYERSGLFRDALEATREQQKLSQQLFTTSQTDAIAALQEEFDSVQRQKQIEMLERDNKLKDADLSNQRLQQLVTLLGAAVVVMGSAFVLLLYRKVQRSNLKLREANQQLEFHSVRDPLTGLYNRRSFLDLMGRRAVDTSHSRRDDGTIQTDGLMIMDIDHFKQINDTAGHAAGDSVLVEIAARLRKTVRDSDMVMRWGGEEFLVYSPKATTEHLRGLAVRLLAVVANPPIAAGAACVDVTISAGFITLPFSGLPESQLNWEKAMHLADQALYLSKVSGRNRAIGLSSLLVAADQAMPVVEQDLREAIRGKMVAMVEVLGPSPAGDLTAPQTLRSQPHHTPLGTPAHA